MFYPCKSPCGDPDCMTECNNHNLKNKANTRDTILAGLFGLFIGATLALVYVYRTGGF